MAKIPSRVRASDLRVPTGIKGTMKNTTMNKAKMRGYTFVFAVPKMAYTMS